MSGCCPAQTPKVSTSGRTLAMTLHRQAGQKLFGVFLSRARWGSRRQAAHGPTGAPGAPPAGPPVPSCRRSGPPSGGGRSPGRRRARRAGSSSSPRQQCLQFQGLNRLPEDRKKCTNCKTATTRFGAERSATGSTASVRPRCLVESVAPPLISCDQPLVGAARRACVRLAPQKKHMLS